MPNISETINKATEILQKSGITEPRREAKSLLTLALKRDKIFLIAYPEYDLTESEENLFKTYLKRRSQHEPFQHISGRQEFWGLNFAVTPDVMIPRPETELIVEAGINILQKQENPRFCEVGVGSGCISISILHDIKNATATGLDISEKALQIAKQNAERIGVSARLDFRISDVFRTLKKSEKFDLIVSNPPYVPSVDVQTLQAEVRDFDPHIALTDGKDGLSIINKLIDESPEFLKPNGFLLLEFGFDQTEKVRKMFSPEIWKTVEFFPDLQGIPRMVKAETN